MGIPVDTGFWTSLQLVSADQEHCGRPPPALLLVLNLLERKKIFSQQVYIITKFITCTFCHRPSLSSLVMPPHSLVPDLLPGPWSHLEEIISSFTVLKSSWHYWFTGSCWQLGLWALRKLQSLEWSCNINKRKLKNVQHCSNSEH